MKRLEEDKKVSLMDRMKKIAEIAEIAKKAQNRPESQFEDEVDMRVIEDEENSVVEPMDDSPEEYIKARMDSNREMIEVYDEIEGKFYKVQAFETGVDDAKSDADIIAEANNWKVTAGIIAGIAVFIVLVFWFCFTLII